MLCLCIYIYIRIYIYMYIIKKITKIHSTLVTHEVLWVSIVWHLQSRHMDFDSHRNIPAFPNILTLGFQMFSGGLRWTFPGTAIVGSACDLRVSSSLMFTSLCAGNGCGASKQWPDAVGVPRQRVAWYGIVSNLYALNLFRDHLDNIDFCLLEYLFIHSSIDWSIHLSIYQSIIVYLSMYLI